MTDAPSKAPAKKSRKRYVVLALFAALFLYLGLWPTPVHPEPWEPPPDPGFQGRFRPTMQLGDIHRLAESLEGPEGITFDPQGRLFTGLLDGRIVRIADDGSFETYVNTGGRPLGMVFAPDGTLFVADAFRGLLEVSTDKRVRVLVDPSRHRMAFVDDVDRTPDGRLIFTDASSRFGLADYKLDLIQHLPRGRLFEYDPRTRHVSRIAGGFYFANGVAVSRDGHWAAVAETGAYRVSRVDLDGTTRGRVTTLIDGLPGFPDNIRRSPDDDVFWVALPSPRDPLLDGLAGHPQLRNVVVRLPNAVQPAPKTTTHFVAVRGDGTVVSALNDTSERSYGPVTTVIPRGEHLYLGSLSAMGIARIAR